MARKADSMSYLGPAPPHTDDVPHRFSPKSASPAIRDVGMTGELKLNGRVLPWAASSSSCWPPNAPVSQRCSFRSATSRFSRMSLTPIHVRVFFSKMLTQRRFTVLIPRHLE